MALRNILTGETALPAQVDGRQGVSWDNSSDWLRERGWRIERELPDVADGYERGPVTWVDDDGVYCKPVYTDTLIADRLAREQVEAQAAALAANRDLWQAGNSYIKLCDEIRVAVGGAATREKLSTADSTEILEAMAAANPQAALAYSVRLLAAINEVTQQGGNWHGIEWHQEVE